MPSKLESLFETSILFPKALSDRIIETVLSPREVDWPTIEGLLDKIVPRVVAFGYQQIPGIRSRLDADGVDPREIVDFRSYEKLFPLTSIPEIAEVGPEQLKVCRTTEPRSQHGDFRVAARWVFQYASTEGKKRKTKSVQIGVTGGDARAGSLALTGQLLRCGELPKKILFNRRPGEYAGTELISEILIPALEAAGVNAIRVPGGKTHIAGEPDTGILMSGDVGKLVDVTDTSAFRLVISVDGRRYPGRMLYAGDLSPNYGVFPNLGYQMPLPIMVRAVDADGCVFRQAAGLPDTENRGRVVLDRFFSVYELPSNWKLLANALNQVLDMAKVLGIDGLTSAEVEALWPTEEGVDMQSAFDLIAHDVGLQYPSLISLDELGLVYSVALRRYFRESTRVGVPSGEWLLKVGLPIAGQISSCGELKSAIDVVWGPDVYVAGDELPVKYCPEEIPHISHAIVGSLDRGQAQLPRLVRSAVSKRIKDVLNGRGLFGPEQDGYLYDAPIVAPSNFQSMLVAAQTYSESYLQEPTFGLTLIEIVEILFRLHELVEVELKAASDGQRSMITLFAEKSRIPISEIADMVKRAKKDYIPNGGRGLKRMAYAAFVDPAADVRHLPDDTLQEGLRAIEQAKPFSPVFMVTPGNINLYDSFCLLSHILLAKLSDQSEKRFTMYLRASESDITFNFLVYH